jgi:hypothetical protein
MHQNKFIHLNILKLLSQESKFNKFKFLKLSIFLLIILRINFLREKN